MGELVDLRAERIRRRPDDEPHEAPPGLVQPALRFCKHGFATEAHCVFCGYLCTCYDCLMED